MHMPPSRYSRKLKNKASASKLKGEISSPIPITPPQPLESQTSSFNHGSEPSLPLHHPEKSRDFAIRRLLAFLPKSTLLNLRLVCRATCNMVSTASPSIFSTLHIDFPSTSLAALGHAARHCRHLIVTFPLPPSIPSNNSSTLPPFPRLTSMHITTPPINTFNALLSFRLALQRAEVPHLTHISISDCTIDGILALRWGGFTSFTRSHHSDSEVWRRLKGLGISVIPWWDTHHSPASSNKSGIEERDTHRTNLKILHSYLTTFATAGSLERLRFTWKTPHTQGPGPNPLLLDLVAAAPPHSTGGVWFSAPPIRWHGLKEVWLQGARVSLDDVNAIRDRVCGLEKLMVRVEDGIGIRGRCVRVEGGGEWFEVGLGGEEVEEVKVVEEVEEVEMGVLNDGREAIHTMKRLRRGSLSMADILKLLDDAVWECVEREGILLVGQ